jgi:hypothetical protein
MPARCAPEPAPLSRETHVWAAGAGRSSWYAFGWLALSRGGFFFRERQDVSSMQLSYMPWLGLTSPWVCITGANLPGLSLVDTHHRIAPSSTYIEAGS